MGDPNRTFREVVPRQKCQNYCHEPAFPNRRNGRIAVSSRIDDVDAEVFHFPIAQMHNPFFRNAQVIDGRRSISASDWESGKFGPQAHPDWADGRFAMSSAGNTFEAIRLNNSEGLVTTVTLQWETQNFIQAATRWENMYSPLVHRELIGKIIPMVDELHEVVGYFISSCSTFDLSRENGELYYARKNDLIAIGIGPDAKSLRDILDAPSRYGIMPQVQSVNVGHEVAYDLMLDVNGLIVSDVRVGFSPNNGTAVSVDWIFDLATAGRILAKLSVFLGKQVVIGTAKGISKVLMKSLVRVGRTRSVKETVDLLRNELVKKVFIARFGSESMMRAPLVRKNVEQLVDYVLRNKPASATNVRVVEDLILKDCSGIDLHSPLQVINLAKGTKVASYADLLHPSNLAGSPKSGSWFTLLRGTHGPDELGVAADGRRRITGMITQDVKVLVSRSGPINDTWTTAVKDGLADGVRKSKGGKAILDAGRNKAGVNAVFTGGGGTQMFHPDAKNVISWGLYR